MSCRAVSSFCMRFCIILCAVVHVLGDVAELVVLVAGRGIHRIGMAGHRSRRDAVLDKEVALVRLGQRVQLLVGQQLAAVDLYPVKVDGVHLDGPQRAGQQTGRSGR